MYFAKQRIYFAKQRIYRAERSDGISTKIKIAFVPAKAVLVKKKGRRILTILRPFPVGRYCSVGYCSAACSLTGGGLFYLFRVIPSVSLSLDSSPCNKGSLAGERAKPKGPASCNKGSLAGERAKPKGPASCNKGSLAGERAKPKGPFSCNKGSLAGERAKPKASPCCKGRWVA